MLVFNLDGAELQKDPRKLAAVFYVVAKDHLNAKHVEEANEKLRKLQQIFFLSRTAEQAFANQPEPLKTPSIEEGQSATAVLQPPKPLF
jgi:outer membrane protein assembly factor BamD (BamD/ComL family)